MLNKPPYNLAVILIDILFVLYVSFAVFHFTQKPFVPKEIAALPSLKINDTPVATHNDIEFLCSSRHAGDSISVVWGERDEPRTIALINYTPQFALFRNLFITVLMFCVGNFVYFRRPGDRAAIIFYLTTTVIAAAIIGTKTIYAVQPWWLGYALCVIFFFAYTVGPAIFVHFTFVFPFVRWKKFPRLMIVLYFIAVVLALWYVREYLIAANQQSLGVFHATQSIAMAQHGFVFLLLVQGVINFIYSYKKAPSMAEKKKIRWMLYGVALGPPPFVFLWALPIALGYAPLVSEDVVKFFLLIVPVTFSIAIIKYRAMDIDVIINRSAVYVVVVGIGLLLYLGVVGVAAKIVTTLTVQTSLIVSTVTAAILALLFEPARRRVQHTVDRLFFRVQYDFRKTQQKFIEEIKQCLDVKSLADLLVKRIDEILPVERIGFFKARDDDHRLQLIAHKNYDILAGRNIRLDMEKLQTRFELPLALDDQTDSAVHHESAIVDMFKRWDMAIVFAMLSEHKEALGFLVLDKKKSGAKFTVEDVDLLNSITTQAGLTVERIELQQKLLIEHAETQRLEELSKMKSYFVSSVSHDLKTPLTSIKMFAELLRTRNNISKSDTNEYLEIIEGESERLTRLINNVLDFAKIERGVKEYRFTEIELNSLVKNVLRILQYQLKIEKCKVNQRLCDKECMINADKDAVIEALINIISNAIKYSHDEKEITISIARRDGFVALGIADRGIGIAKKDNEQIFKPFYRSPEGKIHGSGGAGLGLAIVKHVMDAHGGKIEVESVPGKGSTFTLLFPISKEG
jgi:signal transduction histidine kinase